jgi:hypothetical protein
MAMTEDEFQAWNPDWDALVGWLPTSLDWFERQEIVERVQELVERCIEWPDND